jgi:prephenate dehydrogenase
MTVGVYGLGRFGSFWAEQLAGVCKVLGFSRSPGKTAPPGVEGPCGLDRIAECDALILCNSISSMGEVLQELKQYIRPGMLIMDTCSVKMHPVAQMLKYLPAGTEIIGTHPMLGPDSARGGLEGLPIVLSRVRCGDDTWRLWTDLFTGLKLSLNILTPEEHDREAAWSQGVTHFVGRMLGELPLKESPMATRGYRALLEIIRQTCNDSWQLFVDLQKYNPYTGPMRKELHEALNTMLKELDSIKVEEDNG